MYLECYSYIRNSIVRSFSLQNYSRIILLLSQKKPKLGQKVPTFTTGFEKTRQNNIATIL